jgi:hypothetical protein
VTWAHGHAVHHQDRARAVQHPVQMIHGAMSRRAGGHHGVSGATVQRRREGLGPVRDMLKGDGLQPEERKPRRQQRSQSITLPTITRRPGVQELIPKDQDIDSRTPHLHSIMPRGCQQPDRGRTQSAPGR